MKILNIFIQTALFWPLSNNFPTILLGGRLQEKGIKRKCQISGLKKWLWSLMTYAQSYETVFD